MEHGVWELLKGLLSWVIYPILCLLAWLFKEQASEVKNLKQELFELKISIAVAKSQIDDIKNSVINLTHVIKDLEITIRDDIKELRLDVKHGFK